MICDKRFLNGEYSTKWRIMPGQSSEPNHSVARSFDLFVRSSESLDDLQSLVSLSESAAKSCSEEPETGSGVCTLDCVSSVLKTASSWMVCRGQSRSSTERDTSLCQTTVQILWLCVKVFANEHSSQLAHVAVDRIVFVANKIVVLLGTRRSKR